MPGDGPDLATAAAEAPSDSHHVPEAGYPRLEGSGPGQALRPLVGDAASFGVIDPDVLWSCTTCGACVEQCPVDIEHIDHIVDMRRYQVLVESAFPSEAGVMLRNLENKGNPWGLADRGREEWTDGLDFEVPRAIPGEPLPADMDYLFWVGCAGALEDRSKKVTRAVAELLHTAGVNFAILGAAETCTGDPARRLGNEFLFQMLGMQNVETLDSITRAAPLKIVATCPHCFNTLANEYPQLGGHFDVLHHTELLRRLVTDGRLTPVTAGRRDGHLPRPVLPRAAQQGLRTAAGDPRRRTVAHRQGDASLQGPRLLLRRRWRAILDGREDRETSQHRTHRGSPRPRPRPDLHRLPVLHGHAQRRRHRQASRRHRPRHRPSPRRRPNPPTIPPTKPHPT